MNENSIMGSLSDSIQSINLNINFVVCDTPSLDESIQRDSSNSVTIFNVSDGIDNLQMHFYGWFV